MKKYFYLILVLIIYCQRGSAQAGLCDTAYWNHTYANPRLMIYDSCVTIRATIKILDPPLLTGDGDYHIYVQPDSQYRWMIYYRDSLYSLHCGHDLSGDTFPGMLNVEEICKGTIEDTGPLGAIENAACANFNDNVYLPNTGEYCEITGPLVYDSVHCWNEIHPVSRMILNPSGIVERDWKLVADGLKIFPQPAGKELKFRFEQPPHAVTLIKLYTISGLQLVVYGLSETTTLDLDVSSWPTGEYLYSVVAQEPGKTIRNGKFSVLH